MRVRQFGPTHPSLRSKTAIMITSSDFPVKGSGMPNQYLDVLLHTIRISGLSRVRTEADQLRIVPTFAPHPVKLNRQSARHGNLGRLSSAPHQHMKIPTTPARIAAHRRLGGFHQQKACHRIALFGDVTQAPSLAARFLQRNQPEILATSLTTPSGELSAGQKL